MEYAEIVAHDKFLKNHMLQCYDFAFKLIWADEHHQKIFMYLKSLTMYTRIKGFLHFGSEGVYFCVRFNEDCRNDLLNQINKFRLLFKNENQKTFKEDNCNGCCIFTFE